MPKSPNLPISKTILFKPENHFCMELRKQAVGIRNGGNSASVILAKGKNMTDTTKQNLKAEKRLKFLTEPDLTRTYALEYIPEDQDDLNRFVEFRFSGLEIKNALDLIPKWDYARHTLYTSLHQMIEIASYVRSKKDVPAKYSEAAIDLIQSAENGCVASGEMLQQNLAVFLAMNFRSMMDLHGDRLFLSYLAHSKESEDAGVISYPVFGEREDGDGFPYPKTSDDDKDLEEFKRLVE